MRTNLFLGAALIALIAPAAAMAQSTGTVDIENKDVVVTGTRQSDVAGVQVPDTVKTREVLNQKFISKQTPGQSIDEIINQLPGVSFQNYDPFGSSGGRLTIRGFSPDRISQTLDGVPTNDTGNYSIYSNQLVDPELIEQVNVSLGSTDIDSPTASASGSTVNYRTRNPTDQFGARMASSLGNFNFFRIFGVVDTGVFTSFGTKAWLSASSASNDTVYSNFPLGKISKSAYNGKLYQPIGSNGDFFAIAGNWNVNRNTNTPDFPLRVDNTIISSTGAVTGTRVVGGTSSNRFPVTSDERYLNSPLCQTAAARGGVADTPNTCGTLYEQNVNPSNTGSIRANLRLTLAEGLVFTVDPTFQYTKANGGSYGVVGREQGYTGVTGRTLYGLIGGTYYTGLDLNGDGDRLDQVELDGTSQTVTHRYSVTSSLRYDVTPTQTVRVSYAHDYGRHRQTGELAGLLANGQPVELFPIDAPYTINGVALEKRNRLSYAILDQVSGEYRGEFLDRRLVVQAGVRAPFFKRNLTNYCFTYSATGSVTCLAGSSDDVAAYAAANTYVYNTTTNVVTGSQTPQSRVLKYSRVLPSAGFTFAAANHLSVYGSYSKGLSVPSTDNLYGQTFYYPAGAAAGQANPEVTDNFDAGVRYTSSKIQAQVGPWYTLFTNRIASSYDPDLNQSVYRNLGKVDKYGVDGSVAWQPIREVSLYGFASYLKSSIRDNIVAGNCTAALVAASSHPGLTACTTVGQQYYYTTAGKREAGAPVYTVGGRAEVNYHGFELGGQYKLTGKRYVNDINSPIYITYTPTGGALQYAQVYSAAAAAYTVFDLDLRIPLGALLHNDKTYLQFNATNIFDKTYVGSLGNANTSNTTVPYGYLGAPRAFIGTLNVAF